MYSRTFQKLRSCCGDEPFSRFFHVHLDVSSVVAVCDAGLSTSHHSIKPPRSFSNGLRTDELTHSDIHHKPATPAVMSKPDIFKMSFEDHHAVRRNWKVNYSVQTCGWSCFILCDGFYGGICLFSSFFNVVMLWKHRLSVQLTEHIPELSAGFGLTESIRKRWSEHLLVSKHTDIRLFKGRGREKWRPFLFIYQQLMRLPVYTINIEGWKEHSWFNQLPGRWRMPVEFESPWASPSWF